MPAPVSVIIPTLNVATQIGPLLSALAAALSENLLAEVIFADGGSQDATAEIAEEVGARFVTAPRGRGPQLAAGAGVARGAWLLFLHADSRLPDNWTQAVAPRLADPQRAGYFRLAFDDTGLAARTVAGWANLRARLFHLPYGDQGLLVSQNLYRTCGGHPAIPLMEDVAIARALGRRLHPLPATLTTSAEKYRREGWIRRSLGNAGLLLRYRLGADPAALAARYARDEKRP